MLRIEKDCDKFAVRLRLSGRIQADCIANIQSAMNDGCSPKILDLTEVTIIDVAVVRFLIGCENEGVKLAHCPAYIREWIVRERAE